MGTYFGDTYEALCKEAGMAPAVRMRPGERVLELHADRLKMDDWRRILRSLASDRCLHYVAIRVNRSYGHSRLADNTDSERAARNCKRIPALYTKFIMGSLAESIASVLAHSCALTSLLLCRIPLKADCLSAIVQGLSKNVSLQHLAIQHCPVGDEGAEAIANVFQSKAALTTLELTDCGLSPKGISHLATLIKVHSHERYGECWKYSLRYSMVDKDDLPGLRRLTVNQNPDIGDEGLGLIIDTLYDDMWIRAIDMQRCSLTEDGCREVARLLEINKDLTVFDVRGNQVSIETHRNILLRLEKNICPGQTQFSWLEESVTPAISQMSLVSSRPTTAAAVQGKLPASPTKSTTSVRTMVSDAPWHTAQKQRSRFTVSRRSSVISLAKKCWSAEQMRRALVGSQQSTASGASVAMKAKSEDGESLMPLPLSAETVRSKKRQTGQGDEHSHPPVVRTATGGFKLKPHLSMKNDSISLMSHTPAAIDSGKSGNSSELRKVESSIDLTKSRAKELFSKFLAARMNQHKSSFGEYKFDKQSGEPNVSYGHLLTAPNSHIFVSSSSTSLLQIENVLIISN